MLDADATGQLESMDGIEDADTDSSDEGDSMDTIYRGLSPWEFRHFPAIEPSETHAVLFQLPLANDSEQPRPFRAAPKWDALHVRLPCSQRNQYPVSNPDGTESIQNRWQLITDTLRQRTIRTSHQLESAIHAYNTKYARTWRFRALHQLCAELPDDASAHLFEHTLPGILRLALQLPALVQAPIPLLRAGHSASLSLTQLQCASLLANAFLCTFPRRNTQKRASEYRTYPDINFNRLFQCGGDGAPDSSAVVEKLKCLLHYFARVAERPPTGVVTIMRRCSGSGWAADGGGGSDDGWSQSGATFGRQRLHVASAGTIEDQGRGMLQVDFANKYMGGGVLGRGCVQEEIRFCICPELMVTKLVAERLQPNEALFVAGAERFSAYAGYAGSFVFGGEWVDETPRDEWRRRCCAIVAIDALCFERTEEQYGEELMRRELNKAYAGWAPLSGVAARPMPPVATGNWGCGAFGGDKRLKALLQLMVCTRVCRPLVYYTFGDRELRTELLAVWRWLGREHVTVAQLWSYLKGFRLQRLPGHQLYPYLYQAHRDAITAKRPVGPNNVIASAPPPPVTHPPAASSIVAACTADAASSSAAATTSTTNQCLSDDAPSELSEIIIGTPPAIAVAAIPPATAPALRQRSPLHSLLIASLDFDYGKRGPDAGCATTRPPAGQVEQPAANNAVPPAMSAAANNYCDKTAVDKIVSTTPTAPTPDDRRQLAVPAHKRQASIYDYLKPV